VIPFIDRFVVIDPNEIIFIEADGSSSKFHLYSDQLKKVNVLVSGIKLATHQRGLLGVSQLMHVSNKHLVNLSKIVELSISEDKIVFDTEQELYLPKGKVKKIFQSTKSIEWI
jgi:DNA-binding LytR/AlgR family response regulator